MKESLFAHQTLMLLSYAATKYYQCIGIKEMYFLTGTGIKGHFISIHQTVQKLGTNICELLPAIHAFTGSDPTSCLANIGIKKVLKTIKASCDELLELKCFGSEIPVTDENILMETRLFLSSCLGILLAT